MNLTEPLASLLDTNAAAALRVLSRSQASFTGRQIARLADNSNAASIRNALLRLVATGLVIAHREPHATHYHSNREHVLWPAIETALNARHTVGARISDLAQRRRLPGMTIALYGSVAREEAHSESDIDLLLVLPDDVTTSDRDDFIDELDTSVRLWTGNDVQIYDITHSDLARQRASGDPIVASWDADAITIFGTPLHQAIARA